MNEIIVGIVHIAMEKMTGQDVQEREHAQQQEGNISQRILAGMEKAKDPIFQAFA
jgi:hypothetical protein